MKVRTTLVMLLAATGLIAPMTGASAATPPPPSPAQSVDAVGTGGGLFSLNVHATRAANQPASSATGTFSAVTGVAGVNLLTIAGPVTCLDVRGSRVGLFYPVTSSSPSVLSQIGSGVFITLEVGPNGTSKMVGFLPVPIAKTKTCAPSLALVPFAGSVNIGS